jgi:hypothetical protein
MNFIHQTHSCGQSLLVNGIPERSWNEFLTILAIFVLNVERSVMGANI